MTTDVDLTALTPLAFLRRSAAVFPDKIAVVSPDRRLTYGEFAAEVVRVAGALRALGVTPGDRVAYLSPNMPAMLAGHFAVPLAGGVLVCVNTRLSPEEIRYILDHSGSSILVVHASLLESIRPIAAALASVRHVIVTGTALDEYPSGAFETHHYCSLPVLEGGGPPQWTVEDERSVIAQPHHHRPARRPRVRGRARVRPDRDVRPVRRVRAAARMVGVAAGRAGAPAGAAGGADGAGRPDARGRRVHGGRTGGRPHDGRDRHARQQRHARLP